MTKILIILQPSFLEQPASERAWVEEFSNALVQCGNQVTKFNILEHKITDFEVIHFFSKSDPSNWNALSKMGKLVFVTPSIIATPPKLPTVLAKSSKIAFRLIRGVLQRKWPPIEDSLLMKSASSYFVINKDWKEYLKQSWSILDNEIIEFSADPRKAAEIETKILQARLSRK